MTCRLTYVNHKDIEDTEDAQRIDWWDPVAQ